MTPQTIILNSSDLHEKSAGLRFALPQLGQFATGFVVRYLGKPYAYINQCAHVPIELDWEQGQFFNTSKDFLICATHGAQYEPDTGHCFIGPCKGKSLQVLPVVEQNKQIIINIEHLKSKRL
jgi:nitrite reductase/ring-hydroxylating ferredoxin subunit